MKLWLGLLLLIQSFALLVCLVATILSRVFGMTPAREKEEFVVLLSSQMRMVS